MMRHRLIGCALAVLAMACVDGGDTADAAAQGTLGGSCFPNNTCNPGLACVLSNGKGVCEQSDATVADVAVDQTTGEASADATPDVAPDVEAGCDSGLTPQPVCNANCSNELCCELSGQCINFACGQNCPGGVCWGCTRGTAECGANMFCCAQGTLQGTCPPTASIPNGAGCTGASGCTSGFFICVTNADCPPATPTCVPAKATGLAVSTIGYCQ
jgi:hypothetical protein